jgi:hypothetical protein
VGAGRGGNKPTVKADVIAAGKPDILKGALKKLKANTPTSRARILRSRTTIFLMSVPSRLI